MQHHAFRALFLLLLVNIHVGLSQMFPGKPQWLQQTQFCCRKNAAAPMLDTSKEIVDVFSSVILATADPTEIKSLTLGPFWLAFRYMLLLAKKNTVRIHVITDSPIIHEKGLELGVHMYLIEQNQTFYDLYAPNHVGSAEEKVYNVAFEYSHMYRWLKYADIVQNWNKNEASSKDEQHRIKNILALDSDLLFLVNPHKFYFRALRSLGYVTSDDFDIATIAPGSAQMFSVKGIKAYAHYIYQFYSRPTADIAKQLESVQVFVTSAGSSGGGDGKRALFSDMQMGMLFAHESEGTRSMCFQYNKPPHSLSREVLDLNRTDLDRCMVEKLGCQPIFGYSMYKEFNKALRVKDRLLFYGQDEVYPQCFMHFEGDKSKKLMRVFATYLIHRLEHAARHGTGSGGEAAMIPSSSSSSNHFAFNTSAHHQNSHLAAPSWLKLILNDQIVLRGAERTGDQLFAVRNGVRHLVSDYPTFQKLKLKPEEVIRDVPDALMAVIPSGFDLTVQTYTDFLLL